LVTNASENVNWTVNGSNKCDHGSITATGTIRTNGVGGTVYYGWVRKDANGTQVMPEPAITIPAGDTGVHPVVTDTWTPIGSGSEQLVIVSPGYQAGSTPPAPTPFTCR
jgi:hypothetical protein